MATLLLTDALAESLADAVSEGVPIETAAQAAGVGHHTFFTWLQAAERGVWRDGQPVDPSTHRRLTAFAEQIQRAQAEFEARQVSGITRAAEERNEKTGLQD